MIITTIYHQYNLFDIIFSRLFWSDWDRLYPRIEASNLDGSDRAVLVDSHIIMPNSLVVDVVANELCWADGGGGRSRLHRMTNQWTGLGKIGKQVKDSLLAFSEII